LAIEGSATFIEDPIKGVTNDAVADTIRAEFFEVALFFINVFYIFLHRVQGAKGSRIRGK
jgi:hypothetical protein